MSDNERVVEIYSVGRVIEIIDNQFAKHIVEVSEAVANHVKSCGVCKIDHHEARYCDEGRKINKLVQKKIKFARDIRADILKGFNKD